MTPYNRKNVDHLAGLLGFSSKEGLQVPQGRWLERAMAADAFILLRLRQGRNYHDARQPYSR